MITREIKTNFKSLLIWLGVISFFMLIVFVMYPSLMTSENIELLNQLITVFPEELLKIFNMDIASITSPSGWVKSEGIVLLILATSIYSSLLGFKTVGKEKEEMTIEYLAAKPISRDKILISKILGNLINIILLIVTTSVVIITGLAISNDLDFSLMVMLTLSPLFVNIFIYLLAVLISIFISNKNGLAFGIPFALYFLNILSLFSEKTKFFKYITPFTFSDSRYIIENESLNYISLVIFLISSFILLILSIYFYRKNELI
ncbi:MAG TPA: ABC transporter permease subunit [Acholeplasmataceae bacterium]|nr:ABC transporter permease subunit [Acholeplasmataceae bacterium]